MFVGSNQLKIFSHSSQVLGVNVAQLEAVGADVIDFVEQRTNPVAQTVDVLHGRLNDAAAGRRRMLMGIENGYLSIEYKLNILKRR